MKAKTSQLKTIFSDNLLGLVLVVILLVGLA